MAVMTANPSISHGKLEYINSPLIISFGYSEDEIVIINDRFYYIVSIHKHFLASLNDSIDSYGF